ncbi:MAG: glycoside hydrolase family 32 protein [Aquirufa sp.]
MKQLFKLLNSFFLLAFTCSFQISFAQESISQTKSTDFWRPSVHFSPQKNWTNDPNGLVYYNGYYHLFFQHNPKGNEWGNMSWGHARTKDLLHWEELPVAIPNGNEYIFSGCVVVDKDHVSGLGDPSKPLFIAIYTADYPNTKEEQHLAYSNDEGLTWTKYSANPILNIDYKDFRDPNIIWHEKTKQFIMSVAKPKEYTIQFYGSKNLINWTHLSDFGGQGDIDMIWECPSLMELPVEGRIGEKKWVLSLSSQGPTKKFVGMQYFVGEFDGKNFVNDNPKDTKLYVDFGKDFYAAVPFYNVPKNENLWLAWALSWQYAKEQPTFPWKGQMSSVRKVSLQPTSDGLRMKQKFQPDLDRKAPDFQVKDIVIKKNKKLNGIKFLNGKTYVIDLIITHAKSDNWGINLISSDAQGKINKEKTSIGFDEKESNWYIDRTKSGLDLGNGFNSNDKAPAISGLQKNIRIFVDKSLVEVLAQDGTISISSLRFPKGLTEDVEFFSTNGETEIKQMRIWELK